MDMNYGQSCYCSKTTQSFLSTYSKYYILTKIELRKNVVPGIFGSKNVFLPIFPPTKAIIKRSFKSHPRVNTYLSCPSWQGLSETLKSKYLYPKIYTRLKSTPSYIAFLLTSFWRHLFAPDP